MADNKHRDDSVSEEALAFGSGAKGKAKDVTGSVLGLDRVERDGEREHAEARARQERNEVFEETDGVPGTSVTDRTGGATRGYQSEPVTEDAPAGQRGKGAGQQATGSILGLGGVAREGERDRTEGRAAQSRDDVTADTSRAATYQWSPSNRNFVTGLYDTPETAGKAYQDLTTRHGYKADDISVVMSDETRQKHFGDAKPGQEFKEGTKAAEGAGIGGGIGLGVGAAVGALLAAASSIALPGLGLVVAGPIAGAIAGAGAGGATGSLLGCLIGAGIPEERAAEYERGIRSGGIVLGTHARDEAHAAQLERELTIHGGRNIL